MKKTNENKRKERSEKYDCDGCCYTSTTMCPLAEFCPETRRGEFVATLMAAFTVFLIPIVIIAGTVWAVINFIQCIF